MSVNVSFMLLSLVVTLHLATAVATTHSTRVHHDIDLRLDPMGGTLEVRDRISFSGPLSSDQRDLVFTLNAGLTPVVEEPRTRLIRTQAGFARDRVDAYALKLDTGRAGLTLRYRGRLAQWPEGTAGPAEDPGEHIGPEGVLLTGASHWYPRFGDELVSFSLRVRLPGDWVSVSQGMRLEAPKSSEPGLDRWREDHPQEEIVVAANRFETFVRPGTIADAMVFLREPDKTTAERYLEATERYLRLYDELLGPYPYAKFALVENFWESGYGMPSFTLLGPRVLRLPFIIDSSYPHEILHNWWGNGVYVDYPTGNWSEGLTAYLADHLMQERRGQGAEYRRAALEKYRDFVRQGHDFSLDRFRAKHGEVSEAIGYNKALMFFHMLRRRLGDRVFIDALRQFYSSHRFRVASYGDLRRSFESVSRRNLGFEFDQWIHRIGAPELSLEAVRVEETASGYRLHGRILQTQSGSGYRLLLPIVVEHGGAGRGRRLDLAMDGRLLELDIALSERPLRLAIDPEFDVFRRLDVRESPPVLSEIFGAEETLFVVPARGTSAGAYAALARSMGAKDIRADAELSGLPDDRAVWILGWENAHVGVLGESLAGRGVSLDRDSVHIGEETRARTRECAVLVARRARPPRTPIGWIGCERHGTIAAVARKLPHYGKYSYLSFSGDEARNTLKGRWRATESPLVVRLDPEAPEGPLRLAPRTSLVEAVANE